MLRIARTSVFALLGEKLVVTQPNFVNVRDMAVLATKKLTLLRESLGYRDQKNSTG